MRDELQSMGPNEISICRRIIPCSSYTQRMAGVKRSRLRGCAQLELPKSKTWGGRRAGAGRKGRNLRRNVSHSRREGHARAHPVHVVLRSRVRSLRSQFLFPTVRRALADATRSRSDFRVIQFSVQADHLHLVVEADGDRALSRGMQGLAIRVAKAVNRLVSRRGSVWSDRFFARDLGSPRAVKHAIRYVLNNYAKHGERIQGRRDPCSSAAFTSGAEISGFWGDPDAVPIGAPRTWLARNWAGGA